jgi:Sec-independent protein translocase protein TatA
MFETLIGGILVLAAVAAVLLGAQPLRNWMWRREVSRARSEFRRQRERLEAKFFDLASRSGKPRDLRWLDCEWLDQTVTFARDRQTGLLAAFVAVNIRFEAVEGGEMEGVAAVSNIRDAAAVFHYQAGSWGTGGRALFNMNPADALVRLQGQFEAVGK